MNTKLKGGKRVLFKKLKWDFTLNGLQKTYSDFLQEMNFNSDLVLERDEARVKVEIKLKENLFSLEIFYLSGGRYVKHTEIVFKQETKNMIVTRECYLNQKGFTFDIDKVAVEIISRVRDCWNLSLEGR